MSKRTSFAEGVAIVFVGIAAAIAAAVAWAIEHPIVLGLVLAAVIAIVISSRSESKRRLDYRRKSLLTKYGDPRLVEQIIDQAIWTGQTEEQLRDSLGIPQCVDRHVLKTKRREIWKYQEVRKGQYRIRITLENGEAVSWEIKG